MSSLLKRTQCQRSEMDFVHFALLIICKWVTLVYKKEARGESK
jgi:hypothetical protein